MKRWKRTKVSASSPAKSISPCRNTRSFGTNTSSNTVSVSIILWRALIGCSKSFLFVLPCGRREQLQPGRVDRDRERDGVGLVLGAHRARRQHDHFVGVGRDAGVNLRAAHHDAVGTLLDDAHVVIGMILLRGPERAIAFDVGLRDGDREIVVAAFAVVLRGCARVLGLARRREPLADNMQREQRVGADFLDQHHQRRALARRGRDQLAALEQIVAILRNMIVAAVFVRRPPSRPPARDTSDRAPSDSRAPHARPRCQSPDAP